MNRKPQQILRSANNQFLHQIMQATRRTNDLLCRIDDNLGQRRQQETALIETALQAVPRSGDTPQKIANANPDRVELWICNTSTKNLMIAPFKNINAEQFSSIIEPNKTMRIKINVNRIYAKAIYGFWADGAGGGSTAMITEFFPVPKSDENITDDEQ
jgi:hypothetical protein